MRGYFRKNWGTPFVIGFIILLLFSAEELSVKSANAANNIATYAFYFFVVGIVLQIASYVKYGQGESKETKPPTPSAQPREERNWRRTILGIVAFGIILVAAGWGYVSFTTTQSAYTAAGSQSEGTATITSISTSTVTITSVSTSTVTTYIRIPAGVLAYPYDLTKIAQTLARNGTVTFWYPTGTPIGEMVQNITQAALSYGGPTTTAGGIVGPNMYRITGTEPSK